MTYLEHRIHPGGGVAWIGDGNNMCNSYTNAAERFDFETGHRLSDDPLPSLLRKIRIGFLSCVPLQVTVKPQSRRTRRYRCKGHIHGSGRMNNLKRQAAFGHKFQVSPDLDGIWLPARPHSRIAFRRHIGVCREVSVDMLDDGRWWFGMKQKPFLHAQKALMEKPLLGKQNQGLKQPHMNKESSIETTTSRVIPLQPK